MLSWPECSRMCPFPTEMEWALQEVKMLPPGHGAVLGPVRDREEGEPGRWPEVSVGREKRVAKEAGRGHVHTGFREGWTGRRRPRGQPQT